MATKKNTGTTTKPPAKKDGLVNETTAGNKLTVVKNEELEELFISGLKEMLFTENHLVASIPKMIMAASDGALKAALQDHLEKTKQHADTMASVLEMLDEKAFPQKCDAIEGLTLSGEAAIENTRENSLVRDTAIIMSAQKVENFEITCYNGLIRLAEQTGHGNVVDSLRQNLADEEEASTMLEDMSRK